jgi:hypothetical protein
MMAVTRRSGPEVAIADVVTFIPNGPHRRSRRGRGCQKAAGSRSASGPESARHGTSAVRGGQRQILAVLSI